MIRLISAPSNLGLRPPEPGGVPGTAKAPEALRSAGLWDRLPGAADGGLVLPGRYVDDDGRRPAATVRNQAAILDHGRRLGRRVAAVLESGDVPVVIGGDCSILLGAGLAVAPLGAGLVHVDGHTDFRHPGNSAECGSLAGEDLAAAVGLHWSAVTDGQAPLFPAHQVAHLGHRDDDAHAVEARSVLGVVVSARAALQRGTGSVVEQVVATVGEGFWLQVDVDVLDPSVMPAVDSPAPGGLGVDDLRELLGALTGHMRGMSVTVFDPDLDPAGTYAQVLVDLLVSTLPGVRNNGGRSPGSR